jgi:hypothetical protein
MQDAKRVKLIPVKYIALASFILPIANLFEVFWECHVNV